MSNLSRQLILENIEKHRRGEDARVLDLGNCGMTEVPEEIGECVWLEELRFGKESWNWDGKKMYKWETQNQGPINNITRLTNALAKLHNLKFLEVNGTLPQIQDLEDISIIATLKNLMGLDLSYTRVSNLMPLSKLSGLLKLDCSGTKVKDLTPLANLVKLQFLSFSFTDNFELSPISELKQLQHLECFGTEVSNLSPISGLTQLQHLDCGGTEVSDLSPISGLMQLQQLFCFDTQVSDLSPISGLSQLQQLDCSGTQVDSLSPISGLTQLHWLSCTDTQVSDLSPISGLMQLEWLSCASTRVSDLSPILQHINNGLSVIWQRFIPFNNITSAILVENCPLICPPIEFAKESPQVVRDYFEELGENGLKLNEVKVIFLGDASAGKTSLVKQLMGEAFDSKESQTHGIRICQMPFTMQDGDTVTGHLWDFGGQEVMHATHQFFLSQRSIYVLLLNSRNDDQAEKWLKHAATFGGSSPVLVVLNKIDENPSFEVNRKTLREKYTQIRGFYRLSCKDQEGIEGFHEALRSEIENAANRRTPFPAQWLAVKEHFSLMEDDYIESAQYQAVCEEKGVTKPFSGDVLLQFLHDLGVVINFRNLKNFDTQILNPLWLTNGVYHIINSERMVQTGGLLYENELNDVINDPRYTKDDNTGRVFHYPKSKLQYIVRVMQEFELCFMLNESTWVIPQLLPVEEPETSLNGSVLHFVLYFPDFLPTSIFPRLMVKLHTFIDGNQRWRTGMVLQKPNIFKAKARVRWDKEDRKILVDVCGEERRRFLSFIRETVKEIAATFTNFSYIELVPIPESKEFLAYEELVALEKAGEKDKFVFQVKKKLLVTDLLDGVEEPAMRDEIEQLPVKVFISYAHKDLGYLEVLRSALAPLVRLQKLLLWDDRDINAGDEWEKVLFQQLEEADIVLCLVSSDFVNSDFCYKKEFGVALEAHRRNEKTIVPVMLREVDWKGLPLADIQGVPGKWITSMPNSDEAWTLVSKSLRPAVDSAKQRKQKVKEERQKQERGGKPNVL